MGCHSTHKRHRNVKTLFFGWLQPQTHINSHSFTNKDDDTVTASLLVFPSLGAPSRQELHCDSGERPLGAWWWLSWELTMFQPRNQRCLPQWMGTRLRTPGSTLAPRNGQHPSNKIENQHILQNQFFLHFQFSSIFKSIWDWTWKDHAAAMQC